MNDLEKYKKYKLKYINLKEQIAGAFKCPECDKLFIGRAAFIIHKKNIHNIELTPEEMTIRAKRLEGAKIYSANKRRNAILGIGNYQKCKYCTKQFVSRELLSSHLLVHHLSQITKDEIEFISNSILRKSNIQKERIDYLLNKYNITQGNIVSTNDFNEQLSILPNYESNEINNDFNSNSTRTSCIHEMLGEDCECITNPDCTHARCSMIGSNCIHDGQDVNIEHLLYDLPQDLPDWLRENSTIPELN
jgi:hypothetical protein